MQVLSGGERAGRPEQARGVVRQAPRARRARRAWLVGLALAWLPLATTAEELRLGSVAMDIPAVMHQRLSPLAHFLEQELSQPVALRLSPSMEDAIQAIAAGTVELAYLTPVAYVHAHERGQVRPLVKPLTRGDGHMRLVIAVADDSPIRDPGDLQGRRLAFGDEAALLQRAVVRESGIALEVLGEYRFLGHYDNVVRGVLSGDFDAGVLKDTTALDWEGRGIRIVYRSAPLPPYTFAIAAHMDEERTDTIRRALKRLSADDPNHAPVLAALDRHYQGFVEVDDSDYDSVRAMIAPFLPTLFPTGPASHH